MREGAPDVDDLLAIEQRIDAAVLGRDLDRLELERVPRQRPETVHRPSYTLRLPPWKQTPCCAVVGGDAQLAAVPDHAVLIRASQVVQQHIDQPEKDQIGDREVS